MSLKWQTIILIILILISVTITKLASTSAGDESIESPVSLNENSNSVSVQETSLTNYHSVRKVPTRNWGILDPNIQAEAIMVHSIDDEIPLFYLNSREQWRMASLTKLLTSVVVIERLGLSADIPISESVVATEGVAGNLQAGESYNSRDLLNIMMLVSSNDAAAAFEEYFGGQEEFASILNEKAREIGMTASIFHDGSGLSDDNFGTAADMLKLMKYIFENHPNILNWTRNSRILVQPSNGTESRILENINPFLTEREYLGGKTGTAPLAKQNLAVIVNIEDRKVAIILLGAEDRNQEINKLIDWTKQAYNFNQ